MAPPSATADIFMAVAEPRRREILDLLKVGERAVGEIVSALRLPQPQVSKHLRVLKEVGLVAVRRSGRCRVYSVRAAQLREVHDWAGTFERYWEHQLDRIRDRAEQAAGAAGDPLSTSLGADTKGNAT